MDLEKIKQASRQTGMQAGRSEADRQAGRKAGRQAISFVSNTAVAAGSSSSITAVAANFRFMTLCPSLI